MENFAYITSQIFQYIVLALGIYFFIVSSCGWLRFKEKKGKEVKPEKRFALIASAHNEEAVIAQLVDSLNQIDYPKELFDVYIIADNCTDKTADIARQHGANVFVRFNNVQKGKGFALEWCFNKLFEGEKEYDAFCIFDADNLVHKNFLLEMNKQFCKGYKAVQGYIDSKNPFDSWISLCYSIGFWMSNRLYQLPRYNLGISCGLSGTGFGVSTDLIKKLGWGATCLTEDLEFTAKLVMNNEKVGFAYDAIIYDEKPLTLAQSWKQRKRWMQGFADCTRRLFIPLMKKAFKERSIKALDIALYMVQPVRILLFGVVALIGYLSMIAKPGTFFTMSDMLPSYIFSVILFAQMLYGPLVLIVEKKANLKTLLAYLVLYPIYNLTWVPITIQGVIDMDKKEWSHTLHTRQIDISEVENTDNNVVK